ncbi:MAG: response regulator transcription factor [Candidatus Krumholzibacteriota bacterium]|nr:response regulator transcription factor [Candidatus Krumholzibacteriota bacterium]
MVDLIGKRLGAGENQPYTAQTPGEAGQLLESEIFDVFILAGELDLDNVLELLDLANRLEHVPSTIIIEIDASRSTLRQALNSGCSYFVDSIDEIERIDEITSFLLRENRELIKRNSPLKVKRLSSPREGIPAGKDLSRRENEILHTMLRGFNNREIAEELEISEKTVKNHLWKIYRKFGVDNRTQLFHNLLKSCPCMNLTAGSGKEKTQPAIMITSG